MGHAFDRADTRQDMPRQDLRIRAIGQGCTMDDRKTLMAYPGRCAKALFHELLNRGSMFPAGSRPGVLLVASSL
jgi:hypothetical protein